MKIKIVKIENVYFKHKEIIGMVFDVVNESGSMYEIKYKDGLYYVCKDHTEIVKDVEKSCDNCKRRFTSNDCPPCGVKYQAWLPMEKQSTNADKSDKPLIKLIKVTGKKGFTYYINVKYIISITPTDYGTSIATSDNDGDYLAIDQIGDVLKMLGYQA